MRSHYGASLPRLQSGTDANYGVGTLEKKYCCFTAQGETNASNETFEKIGPEVRESREQKSCERNAAEETRNSEVRTWWQGRQSEKPQTGDCDWAFGSSQEGRKGASKEIVGDRSSNLTRDRARSGSRASPVSWCIASDLCLAASAEILFRDESGLR